MPLQVKRHLAIVGLSVFVLGVLVLPTAHRWMLPHAGEMADCARCQTDHAADTRGSDHSSDPQPKGRDHDPRTCRICQLARMPIATLVPALLPPTVAVLTESAPLVVGAPVLQFVRLFPFSCGPPA